MNLEKVSQMIGRPFLARLLAKHYAISCDENLAQIAKTSSPSDAYSISQYLLGLPRFKCELVKIFGDQIDGYLLDLGCGAGHWSLSASPIFKTIYALDPSMERLKIGIGAAANLNISNVRFQHHLSQPLPYPDNFFSAALCYNVLSYIPPPRSAFLTELKRVMKPGAKIFLGFEGPGALAWRIIDFCKHPEIADLHEILRIFLHIFKFSFRQGLELTDRRLEGTILDCGFSKIEKRPPSAIFFQTGMGQPFFREYILTA